LRGLLDESINFLNLRGSGDVSRLRFEEIYDFFRRYSQSQARSGKGPRYTLSKFTKSTTSAVTRDELGNLLENFKIDLLGTLSLHLDNFQFKNKQEDEKKISFYFLS
jgi:hypothetical protein